MQDLEMLKRVRAVMKKNRSSQEHINDVMREIYPDQTIPVPGVARFVNCIPFSGPYFSMKRFLKTDPEGIKMLMYTPDLRIGDADHRWLEVLSPDGTYLARGFVSRPFTDQYPSLRAELLDKGIEHFFEDHPEMKFRRVEDLVWLPFDHDHPPKEPVFAVKFFNGVVGDNIKAAVVRPSDLKWHI